MRQANQASAKEMEDRMAALMAERSNQEVRLGIGAAAPASTLSTKVLGTEVIAQGAAKDELEARMAALKSGVVPVIPKADIKFGEDVRKTDEEELKARIAQLEASRKTQNTEFATLKMPTMPSVGPVAYTSAKWPSPTNN